MNLNLAGKAVLVLASSRGLGFACAQGFAAEGAQVMLTGRNEETLDDAAESLTKTTGQPIRYQVCDITNPVDIQRAIDGVVEEFGTIDTLVNNAGGPPAGNFDHLDDQAWQRAFELNLLSFIRAIRAALPHMRHQGSGRIVNIASSSIKAPIDGLLLSNVMRPGILGLAKGLSQELATQGIMINTIGPGTISTERIKELFEGKAATQGISLEEVTKQAIDRIPAGRLGDPEEFARLAVFLGSPANSYITGQAILVDGGMVTAL